MNFFTIPWYVILAVIVLVMIVLIHVYKKPKDTEPDKPEVLPDKTDQLTELHDLASHVHALFVESVSVLSQEFREKIHTAPRFFELLVLAAYTTEPIRTTVQWIHPMGVDRLQYISNMLLNTLNDYQLQEISLRLIKFCEEELGIGGLNDEAFRHRSQVNQSIRLLEMARAILTYLSGVRPTLPSNFVRQFNHVVVHTLYAKAMADVVKAKKNTKNIAKNKFHQHNREQRAKRLQRQARDRPKTN